MRITAWTPAFAGVTNVKRLMTHYTSFTMSRVWIENALLLFVAFAAPVPWWLMLLHRISRAQAKYWRMIVYLAIGPLWLLGGCAAFYGRPYLFAYHFAAPWPLELLGLLALLAAVFLDWQVMKNLGAKRLICLTEIQGQGGAANLTTAGIYNYARHPRYVEFPLWPLGLGFIFGYPSFVLFALFLFLAFWAATYFEEAELAQRFGSAYLDYQKRVPRFFIKAPCFWRTRT